jgi:prepilin-type N-terminal cleavage/methylation domain-containing protein
MKSARKAFTLVEIMIVVLIIGILFVLVLLPVRKPVLRTFARSSLLSNSGRWTTAKPQQILRHGLVTS